MSLVWKFKGIFNCAVSEPTESAATQKFVSVTNTDSIDKVVVGNTQGDHMRLI